MQRYDEGEKDVVIVHILNYWLEDVREIELLVQGVVTYNLELSVPNVMSGIIQVKVSSVVYVV